MVKFGFRTALQTLKPIAVNSGLLFLVEKMSDQKREYCLVLEGTYLSENEAEHALRDPFIEEWVEETGRFRLHDLDKIEVTQGVPLSLLSLSMAGEGVFEIVSSDEARPFTEQKARLIAEVIERQGMFDEVRVETFD